MHGLDLSRFNATSFERLVRTLAFRLFGPSGTVYPHGPDGGRDFTIEGVIRGYEDRGWTGYLVLQAKFRDGSGSVSSRASSSDAAWLCAALEGEKAKYVDAEAGLRRPDYYIVASNVSLSGADGKAGRGRRRTGGLSKVDAALRGWRAELGLIDHDVWGADKIATLIGDAPDIRRTYAAWITPGDVLSAMLDRLDAVAPDFRGILRRATRKAIRRDLNARLRDAGNASDDQVSLAKVFVDLPLRVRATAGIRSRVVRSSSRGPHLLLSLVERAREKLDGSATRRTAEGASSPERADAPARNKVVLLGGPGQGKSTAATFAAQLFRANILRDVAADATEPSVAEIFGRASAEGIPVSIPLRYPAFVSLPRYADGITAATESGVPATSLLAHVARILSVDGDGEVGRDQMRVWLGMHPWLLVLDGLDEVPPSGERGAVLQAIREFEEEVRDAEADVLLLVTTRPQGYNRDLPADRWEHWELDDLSPERAMAYASALARARYPDDPDRRDDVLRSLGEAAARPTTSRLMGNPLQVTIMHMIVDTRGGFPPARWSLFKEYYEILLQRERAKGGPTRQAIERAGTMLTAIHERAGLVLHIDSEGKGSAAAAFDKDRFEDLVRGYLSEQGYGDAGSSELLRELSDLALHRLVLLTAREEGRIGFDVRSLQEFMAAAALTSDGPEPIQERLLVVSGISHWRNVFLIAASRFFSESSFHYLRPYVCAIAHALEAGSRADLLARSGARLALDMLADGLGLDHPASRRLLAQHALELLDLGPADLDERLAGLWEPETSATCDAVLRKRLAERTTPPALASWKLALALAGKGVSGMCALAEVSIPDNAARLGRALDRGVLPFPSAALVEGVRTVFLAAPVSRFVDLQFDFLRSLHDQRLYADAPSHLPLSVLDFNAEDGREIGLREVDVHPGVGAELSVRICLVDDPRLMDLQGLADAHPTWRALGAVQDFVSAPSAASLVAVVASLARLDLGLDALRGLTFAMPWPVAAVLREARQPGDLERLADDVGSGAFGDVDDWRAAEARWHRTGIEFPDFIHASAIGRPFDAQVARVGMPALANFSVSVRKSEGRVLAVEMARFALSLPDGPGRADVVLLARWALLGLEADIVEDRHDALTILALCDDPTSGSLYANLFAVFADHLWTDAAFVDRLADVAPRCAGMGRTRGAVDLDRALAAFLDHPERRRGLIHVLSKCILERVDGAGLLGGLDAGLVIPRDGDPASVRRGCAVLSYIAGHVTACEASAFLSEDVEDPDSIATVQRICAGQALPVGTREDLIIALVDRLSDHPWRVAMLCRTLKPALDARRARLSEAEEWSRLQLPPTAFRTLLSGS